MARPKKEWVLTDEEVMRRESEHESLLNGRIRTKFTYSRYWVRVLVEGEAFYVPAIPAQDIEDL
jgi:hypothetical protein